MSTTPADRAGQVIDQADRAAQFREQMVRAVRIANESTLQLIRDDCTLSHEGEDGTLWYDTSPLLDPREYSAPVIDMHRQVLAYGEEQQLFTRHPAADMSHLVRLQRRPLG